MTTDISHMLLAGTSNSPPILGLPNELLTSIADSVHDLDDLHNIRLAGNARLSKSVLEAIEKRRTTIYLEQSKASLDRFLTICRDPKIAYHIRDIRYVAATRSLLPTVLRDRPLFRKALEQFGCSKKLKISL